MSLIPKIIKGGSHTDERGTLGFINDFDLSEVKRFYKITHPNTSIIRGWRAHKIEQRWFHVVEGVFEIRLVKIDDWNNPSRHLIQTIFELSSSANEVLHIPIGYAIRLKASVPNSILLVFADKGIEEASKDDYLFPADYFNDIAY